MAMQSGFIKRIRDIMRMDAGINGDAQRIEQMVWMLFLKVYDAKEDDWELNEENYQSIIPEDCRWRNWAKADSNGQAMTGDKLLNFVNNVLFPVLKGNDVKEGDTVLYEGIRVTPETPIKKAIVKSTFEDANNYMKDGVYLRQVINVIDEIEFDDVKESHAFGFVYEEILRELQAAGSSGEFYTPRAVTEFMAQMVKPRLGEKMADLACGTGGFITAWLGQLAKQVKDVSDQKLLEGSIYGIEKKPFPYLLCVTNMLLHDIEVPNIDHANSLKHNLLDYTDADKFDVILMNPPYGGHEDKSIQGFFPDDLASSETADLFLAVILHRLKKGGRAAVVLPDGFLFGTDNAKMSIKKKLLAEFNLHTVIRLPGSVFAPYTSITTNLLFFDNTGKTEQTWFYRMDMPEGYKHFSKTKPMKPEHFAPVIEWWNDRRELTVDGFDKAKKYTCQQLTEELGYNLDQCGYPHEEEEILDPMDLIQRYQEERASMNAEIDRVLDAITAKLGGTEL
jgi:type I restriction enzyme M protein